jgi:asparagine synthase (glutamine-hydrolysing)
MCGIFALLRIFKTSESRDLKLVQQEFEKIKHRGPDQSSTQSINEDVFFGFHRLAINGQSNSSNQPLELNGAYLICNGEIFNYKQLIEDHKLDVKTDSDCEVILHLYHKYGLVATLKLLDGEFAFCLYDTIYNLFFVARDHIGIRPLFIGKDKEKSEYGFASEAKALVNLFPDVRQYLPGKYTKVDLNTKKCETIRWFFFDSMSVQPKSRGYGDFSRVELLKKIQKLLINSVSLRVNTSDRPVGTFLSGGLDSSLVTSIAVRTNPNLHCFSIGMKGSLDLKASIKVAEFLELKNHHLVTVTLEDALTAIPQVIKSLETYDITTVRASTFQWLLSKYISENTDVKVLLSGEVPDESIPGYWAFAFCKSDEEFKKLSQTMIEELHEYDLLRTDRTTANFGLEVRVPFADRKLLELFHNIKVDLRRFDQTMLEKSMLRDAFNSDWLPDSILYRKKHAFSDAVDGDDVCFHKEVEKYAASRVSEKEWLMRKEMYPINTPVSRESFYYRKIFEEYYPGQEQLLTKFWMPQVKDTEGNLIVNPSATVLPGHKIDTNF